VAIVVLYGREENDKQRCDEEIAYYLVYLHSSRECVYWRICVF